MVVFGFGRRGLWIRWGRAPRRPPTPSAERIERIASGGPGCFDSSWDLNCGLEVCEGLPANLSVSEWWMLAQQQGPPHPAAPLRA